MCVRGAKLPSFVRACQTRIYIASCNSCNIGKKKRNFLTTKNSVTDFVSGRFELKRTVRKLCVNIFLYRKMMICSRPMAELLWKSLQKMTWKMRYIIFHQGTRNRIFIGYGNFCRHDFKTWKRWPNVSSFDPCPSFPGYKRFFFPRAGGCLGVIRRPTVDRNRKPRMKSLWHPGYVHPFHP